MEVNSNNKFYGDLKKSKDLVFDYEVSKLKIEEDKDLISKMYFQDKQTNKESSVYFKYFRDC